MGHIAGSKNNLIPLIDRLNQFPIALVDNDILRELLSILFDETEAFVASKFPLREATIDEISAATKIDEDKLEGILESMALKGIVMDIPFAGKTYYLLMPGLIGFFEFTFMRHRKELPLEKVAKLMSDYFEQTGKKSIVNEAFGSKTQVTRSLVYDEHIPVSSTITDYESAREIIKQAKNGSVGMCFCRHKKQHEGKECKKGAPVDGVCISLGRGAEFLARRGIAEAKSKDELLEILDRSRDLNLTYITDNVRNKPTFICNCCGCCCEILGAVKKGYYDGIAKTGYLAYIDPEKCEYCGDCFTACNVRSIALKKNGKPVIKADRISEVKNEICLGCAACISACEKGAISLIERGSRPSPRKNMRDLHVAILKEKGRLRPYIVNEVKRKVKKAFKRG